jgi:uncharacterized membrane protein
VIRSRRSVGIERPPEEVFAYLARFENGMAWRTELREIQRASQGPEGPGTRYRERLDWSGREVTVVLEITALQPGSRITYLMDGDVRGLGEYRVTGREDGTTRVDVVRDVELRGTLAESEDELFEVLRRQSASDLAHLKDILEHRWAWRVEGR